jgi:hypothetical protein
MIFYAVVWQAFICRNDLSALHLPTNERINEIIALLITHVPAATNLLCTATATC